MSDEEYNREEFLSLIKRNFFPYIWDKKNFDELFAKANDDVLCRIRKGMEHMDEARTNPSGFDFSPAKLIEITYYRTLIKLFSTTLSKKELVLLAKSGEKANDVGYQLGYLISGNNYSNADFEFIYSLKDTPSAGIRIETLAHIILELKVQDARLSRIYTDLPKLYTLNNLELLTNLVKKMKKLGVPKSDSHVLANQARHLVESLSTIFICKLNNIEMIMSKAIDEGSDTDRVNIFLNCLSRNYTKISAELSFTKEDLNQLLYLDGGYHLDKFYYAYAYFKPDWDKEYLIMKEIVNLYKSYKLTKETSDEVFAKYSTSSEYTSSSSAAVTRPLVTRYHGGQKLDKPTHPEPKRSELAHQRLAG